MYIYDIYIYTYVEKTSLYINVHTYNITYEYVLTPIQPEKTSAKMDQKGSWNQPVRSNETGLQSENDGRSTMGRPTTSDDVNRYDLAISSLKIDI